MKKIAATLVLAVTSLSMSASAETIYGVTVYKDLIRFDSANPNVVVSTVPISGIVDDSESVRHIDFRTATQQLYALGNAPGNIYRLYTIDLGTGVATQIGTSLAPSFSGTNFGFDFDPTADQIRIVNDAGQNRRYNSIDGTLSGQDTNLAYASGDPNEGAFPTPGDVAYTNNFAGATSTSLFSIDSGLDTLVRHNPPNGGTLSTVGSLGVNFFPILLGFDISGLTGTAFAATSDPSLNPETNATSQLYTINLSSGAATALGEIGSGLAIISIAVGPIPEPSTVTFVALGAVTLLGRRRNRASD